MEDYIKDHYLEDKLKPWERFIDRETGLGVEIAVSSDWVNWNDAMREVVADLVVRVGTNSARRIINQMVEELLNEYRATRPDFDNRFFPTITKNSGDG